LRNHAAIVNAGSWISCAKTNCSMTGTFARRLLGQGKHKYTFIGSHAEKDALQLWRRKHFVLLIMLVALAGFVVVFAIGYVGKHSLSRHPVADLESRSSAKPCDTITHGFQCHTDISHYWGWSSHMA
jgi:hypothetical protein